MKPAAPKLPPIRTRVGCAADGDNRLWGRSMRHEVVGKVSYSGLAVLSITGHWISPEDGLLVDDLIAAVTAIDPRIWPLKVGRIVSSYGHAVPGQIATQLALSGEAVGPLAVDKAAKLLVDLEPLARDAAEAEIRRRLAAGERLAGFGTPFRTADERVVALRESIERRGKQTMHYWQIAELAAAVALATRGLAVNLGLYSAAIFLEIGLSPSDASIVMYSMMTHMYAALAYEGAARSEAQLRRLPADAVEYVGRAPRSSPRAQR